MISSAAYSIALTPSGAIEEWRASPLECRAHAVLALVADDDLHLGRLADEGAERLDPFFATSRSIGRTPTQPISSS